LRTTASTSALDALGPGGVVHQTADLVEKPIARLDHLKTLGAAHGGLRSTLRQCDLKDKVQGADCAT